MTIYCRIWARARRARSGLWLFRHGLGRRRRCQGSSRCGALVRFRPSAGYLVYASLFGGALTILLLQFRQWPLPYPLSGQAWLIRLHDKESGIPYGIALAIGALMIYPETEWIKAVDLAHFAIR